MIPISVRYYKVEGNIPQCQGKELLLYHLYKMAAKLLLLLFIAVLSVFKVTWRYTQIWTRYGSFTMIIARFSSPPVCTTNRTSLASPFIKNDIVFPSIRYDEPGITVEYFTFLVIMPNSRRVSHYPNSHRQLSIYRYFSYFWDCSPSSNMCPCGGLPLHKDALTGGLSTEALLVPSFFLCKYSSEKHFLIKLVYWCMHCPLLGQGFVRGW